MTFLFTKESAEVFCFFSYIIVYLSPNTIGEMFSGNFTEGATPVPIPNTAVKPFEVDGTLVARLWESRTLPG